MKKEFFLNRMHNVFKGIMAVVLIAIMLTVIVGAKKIFAEEIDKSQTEQNMENHSRLFYEDGEPIDPEDFDYQEQFEIYGEEEMGAVPYSLAENAINNGSNGVIAVSRKYKITGLDRRVVQNFYVEGNYLYTTQVKTVNGSSEIHIRKIGKADSSTFAYNESNPCEMILKGAGHGTTLYPYTYNGKNYLLVCAKERVTVGYIYNSETGNYENYSYYRTIQIGRVQFQNGVTVEAKDIPSFCNINYASKNASNIGTLRFVCANVTSDESRILLRVENENRDTRYSVYDFKTFNEQLDIAEGSANKVISFQGNTTMKNACSTYIEEAYGNVLAPNGSCQGIDISNADTLYVSSGNMSRYSGSTCLEPLRFAMMNSQGKNKKSYVISVPYTSENAGNYWEMEGVQIANSSEIYICLCPKSRAANTGYAYEADKTTAYIYAINRSDLN